MTYTKQQYKKFFDKVGSRIGWDFSKCKYTATGVKWELYQEVVKKSQPDDLLLDIGTGGGERILKICQNFRLVIAIDHSLGMIQTAQKNLSKAKTKNCRFFHMDAEKLQFPDGMFDMVSCRHSDFLPAEIYRVLVPGGYFLTQQVGPLDKENITKFFGRGQFLGMDLEEEMNNYVTELKKAGFKTIQTKTYNSAEIYHTPHDLIFLLKHTPTIPDFGKTKSDFTKLEKFIAENTTKKGIKTNSHRYMIIAGK